MKKKTTKKIKGHNTLNNVEDFLEEGINEGIYDEESDEFDENFVSPVYNVIPISVDLIHSNDYNPNSVASPEMELLATSILEDGYTQPIVVSEDGDGTYTIVDGFHRYTLAKEHPQINKREKGNVPCVIIKKSLTDRVASTIRHNRARGTHDVSVMSNIVSNLIKSGIGDDWIKRKVGLDSEELLRLKQVSGIAELFKDKEFSKSWVIE